ncbi:MAG TPA: class I SAM-dependent methyltransferase [Acetobacteraceae bacterium]|nr:class I SAM-dependent methyltransferase [Acetobacteraceae bacterium]
MKLRRLARQRLSGAVRRVLRITEQDRCRLSNADTVLAQVAHDSMEAAVNDAVGYVKTVRDCIEPFAVRIAPVRHDDAGSELAGKRFNALLDLLSSGVPPLPLAVAIDVARLADSCHALNHPIEAEAWAADAGIHFAVASSFGRKGRILACIVRLFRPRLTLELGTAYGMSAIFIMEALRNLGLPGRLITVEGFEPQYSIACRTLTGRYGQAVSCRFGLTEKLLPELAQSGDAVDFMFHDAAHSGEAYVRDFNAIVGALAPGSVVVFDDIRWNDARFRRGPAGAYAGWRQVAAHARVRRAIEIGDEMGVALLR